MLLTRVIELSDFEARRHLIGWEKISKEDFSARNILSSKRLMGDEKDVNGHGQKVNSGQCETFSGSRSFSLGAESN